MITALIYKLIIWSFLRIISIEKINKRPNYFLSIVLHKLLHFWPLTLTMVFYSHTNLMQANCRNFNFVFTGLGIMLRKPFPTLSYLTTSYIPSVYSIDSFCNIWILIHLKWKTTEDEEVGWTNFNIWSGQFEFL